MQDCYRGNCNVIPKRLVELITDKRINKCDTSLRAFLGYKTKASRKIWLEVKHKGECQREDFFVVEDNEQTLLNGDLCEKLGLVQRIAKVEKHFEFYDVAEPYADVFKCFGKLKGVAYHIKLKT